MAASERRDGGRGGRWAAALASSFDDVVGDDPPGLTDTIGTGKGRDVRYKAAAAPNIAKDGGRRTAEEGGARARTEGPPSAAGAFSDSGAGTGMPASSSAAWARVVASLRAVTARARARAWVGASSSVVGGGGAGAGRYSGVNREKRCATARCFRRVRASSLSAAARRGDVARPWAAGRGGFIFCGVAGAGAGAGAGPEDGGRVSSAKGAQARAAWSKYFLSAVWAW